MTAGRLGDGRLIVVSAALLALGAGWLAAHSPLAAVGAAAAIGIGYLVLFHAKAVLVVVVAMLPWENALRYPSETISAVKILGLLLALSYVLRALSQRTPLRMPWTLVAALLLLMAVGISLIFSPDPQSGVTGALRYLLFVGFLFLVVQLATERRDLILIMAAITLSLTVAGLWGVILFLQGEAGVTPLGHPVDFGYLIATTIPLAAYLLKYDEPRRLLWGFSMVVLLAATLTTFSRGALVGLAALAVWAIVTRRASLSSMLAALLVLGCVVFIAFSFASPVVNDRLAGKEEVATENTASRLAFWSAAVFMAADNPLTGVGPDRFGVEGARGYIRDDPSTLADPVVHNSYLEILAENGALAFLAFLAFLGGSWSMLGTSERRSAQAGDLSEAGLAGALKASLVVAAASGMFISAQVLAPFWLVGGLAAALHYEARSRAVADDRHSVHYWRPPTPAAATASGR